jgi:hypothetical protein
MIHDAMRGRNQADAESLGYEKIFTSHTRQNFFSIKTFRVGMDIGREEGVTSSDWAALQPDDMSERYIPLHAGRPSR